MEALFFLIPLALIFCVLIVKAFFWAVSHRQFENLDSAAHSILFDEDESADADKFNGSSKLPSPADTESKR